MLKYLLEKNFSEYLTLTFLIQLCFGNKKELTLIRNSPLSRKICINQTVIFVT